MDFDFFIQNSFNQEVLALELAKIGTFTESDISKNTLLGLFNKVKFSIFKYAYPVLFQTHHFKGIQIFNPRDIMAMKLAAIMDRGTKKADASAMPKMLAKVEWDEVKDFFKHEPIRLTKKYI